MSEGLQGPEPDARDVVWPAPAAEPADEPDEPWARYSGDDEEP
jgi:hypothetical protein